MGSCCPQSASTAAEPRPWRLPDGLDRIRPWCWDFPRSSRWDSHRVGIAPACARAVPPYHALRQQSAPRRGQPGTPPHGLAGRPTRLAMTSCRRRVLLASSTVCTGRCAASQSTVSDLDVNLPDPDGRSGVPPFRRNRPLDSCGSWVRAAGLGIRFSSYGHPSAGISHPQGPLAGPP